MLLPATFRATRPRLLIPAASGVCSGSIVAVNAYSSGSFVAVSAYPSGSNDRTTHSNDVASSNSAGSVLERLFWRFDRRTYRERA